MRSRKVYIGSTRPLHAERALVRHIMGQLVPYQPGSRSARGRPTCVSKTRTDAVALLCRASLGVFPWYYHAFFTLVEPALTLGGAAWAIFSPDDYHRELIPVAVAAKPSLIHPSSVMAVRQLGSCESSARLAWNRLAS